MQHMDEGRLQAWLDLPRSGLAPDEASEVERHLQLCDVCRARADELARMSDRVDAFLVPDERDLGEVPSFDGVVARARDLQAGAAERPRPRRPWLAAGWAASVVLAIGAGWAGNELIRRGGTPASPELAAEADSPPEIEIPPPPETIAVAEQGVEAERVAPSVRSEQPERVASAAAPALADAPADTGSVVIRGRVTDPEGRPLEAAQISTDNGAGALSRADGTFEVTLPTRPRPGDSVVTVQAQLLGYAADRRALPVTPSGSVTTDFQLSPAAIALSEVVVTGTPAPEAAARARREDDAGAGVAADAPIVVPALDAPGAWRRVSVDEAAALSGFRPLGLDGLDVDSLRVGNVLDGTVLLVAQTLATGERVDLLQALRPVTPASRAAAIAAERTVVGARHVTALAPVDADTLRRLLATLREVGP